jgi:PhnB protein
VNGVARSASDRLWYVEDVRRTFAVALSEGAESITEPTEMPFGELVARFRDRQGHRWWIHERTEEVDLAEMGRRFLEPKFQKGLAYLGNSLTRELSASHDEP